MTTVTTFELRQASLPWGDFREVTARSAAARTALLGNWDPLFRHLLGQLSLDGGEVLVGGQSAREQVITGQVGLVHPELAPPEDETVSLWLTESLRLFGETRNSAKQLVTEVLQQLEVTALTTRRGSTLNELELAAARFAQALCTRPHTLFIQLTACTPEQGIYERALAARVGARVLVACELPRQLEWVTWCEESLWAPAAASAAQLPAVQAASPQRRYLLTPLEHRAELEAALVARGMGALNPGHQDLVVQVGEGQGPKELLAAAAAVGAPLARLIPLG
ncbi:MAG: hypothetical protein RJA70_328 [Pseudomonadota bacterium]